MEQVEKNQSSREPQELGSFCVTVRTVLYFIGENFSAVNRYKDVHKVVFSLCLILGCSLTLVSFLGEKLKLCLVPVYLITMTRR